MLRVSLRPGSGLRVEELKERLRNKLDDGLKAWLAARWKDDGLTAEQIAGRIGGLRLSFEPADIVNEVMSFGSPTPIEVQVSGPNMADNLDVRREDPRPDVRTIPRTSRPAVRAPLRTTRPSTSTIDRAEGGDDGHHRRGGRVQPDPGHVVEPVHEPELLARSRRRAGYQVQVQIPPPQMNSISEIGIIPVSGRHAESGMKMSGHARGYGPNETGMNGAAAGGTVYLCSIATIRETTHAGRGRPLQHAAGREHDREHRRRRSGHGRGGNVMRAVGRGWRPAARACEVDVRGPDRRRSEQVHPRPRPRPARRRRSRSSCCSSPTSSRSGWHWSRSRRCPPRSAASGSSLLATGTTLNLQSFMGAIMAVGVAVANAILLVTFAERSRLRARRVGAGRGRRRPQRLAADPDDQLRDDRRHGADGARAGRRRRPDGPARPGRDRRPGGVAPWRRCSSCRRSSRVIQRKATVDGRLARPRRPAQQLLRRIEGATVRRALKGNASRYTRVTHPCGLLGYDPVG